MGNSASSLPYVIGKQVSIVNDGWSLHEGNRKSDNEAVSVFVAKKANMNKTPIHRQRDTHMNQFHLAKHHYTHCKKLRHPHILKVYATLDTDNPNDASTGGPAPANSTASSAAPVRASTNTSSSETGDYIVVTEPCILLDVWLNQHQPTLDQIAYGIECVVKALHFLHTSSNAYSHGNVSPTSLYVTKSGDIKLWNFSLITSFSESSNMSRHFIDHESLVTPDVFRSPERKERRWDAIMANGPHTMDGYSLGILIDHFYKQNIPLKLVKAVQRLQTNTIKMRPKLFPLLKCPVFETQYSKIQTLLEEIQVQPVEQKIHFWNTTILPALTSQPPHGANISKPVAIYKILPYIKHTIETICSNESLRTQDMYRREVQSTLLPLFFIAESYLSKEECVKLGSIIKLLFNVNDRAIRGILLQKAAFLQGTLDADTLNSSVFEPMCSGFSDSSAGLRELTLKATLVLVPQLTHPSLEKLARYLVRLQGDQETSIRTNTVIFFSKLAPYLTETSRQKMLLPAYVRAMKDPFTPCRNAALKSALQSKEFFTPDAIAMYVLPAITPRLLDQSPDVRREAFMAVDDLLSVLRRESERLASIPQPGQNSDISNTTSMASQSGIGQPLHSSGHVRDTPRQQIQPTPSSGPVSIAQAVNGTNQAPTSQSASTSWGITSWIGSSKGQIDTDPSGSISNQAPPQQNSTISVVMPSGISQVETSTLDDNWSDDSEKGEDAWDEDDDLDLSPGKVKLPGASTSRLSIPSVAPLSGNSSSLGVSSSLQSGGEDEFFDAFETKPAKPIASARMGSAGLSSGKLVIPKKSGGSGKLAVPKPAIKKLASGSNDIPNGWDDF